MWNYRIGWFYSSTSSRCTWWVYWSFNYKSLPWKKRRYKRTKIIVPDSAHGTNPASASVAGFDIVEIKSGEDGRVSIEELKKVLNDEIAGLMLTNPSTLGLFEKI